MAGDPKGRPMARTRLFGIKEMQGVVLNSVVMGELGRGRMRVEPGETAPIVEFAQAVVRVAKLSLELGRVRIALDPPPD